MEHCTTVTLAAFSIVASLACLRWLHLGKKKRPASLALQMYLRSQSLLMNTMVYFQVWTVAASPFRVVAYPLPLFKEVGPPVRHTKTANAELVGSLQCFLSKEDTIKVHSCNSSLLKPFENGLIKLHVLLNPGLLASVVEGLSFFSFFDFTPFQDNGIQCRRCKS